MIVYKYASIKPYPLFMFLAPFSLSFSPTELSPSADVILHLELELDHKNHQTLQKNRILKIIDQQDPTKTMVFSSIPAYLDPANWQQQPSHQTGNNINHINHHANSNPHQQLHQQQIQPQPAALLQPPLQPGSIRPGSMAERARMANIPMPEPALKCPRCESANTKFCYFNNYSLTQPRHFCKTCRRYWTRGGALRNVPVGGGCRRNKRTKSGGTSKSPASSGDRGDRQTASSSTTSNNTASSNASHHHHMPSLLGLTPPQIPPLRFLSPMSQLSEHFGGGSGDIGLNYGAGGGISAPPAAGMTTSEMNMNFHVSPNMLGNGMASILSSGGGGSEPWRLQQHFPFLGGLDSSLGLYQVQNNMMEGFVGETSQQQFRPPVKMENNQELSLSRQLMGMNPAGNSNGNGNQQEQWNMNMNSGSGAANWTDLASFSSSSATAPM